MIEGLAVEGGVVLGGEEGVCRRTQCGEKVEFGEEGQSKREEEVRKVLLSGFVLYRIEIGPKRNKYMTLGGYMQSSCTTLP